MVEDDIKEEGVVEMEEDEKKVEMEEGEMEEGEAEIEEEEEEMEEVKEEEEDQGGRSWPTESTKQGSHNLLETETAIKTSCNKNCPRKANMR